MGTLLKLGAGALAIIIAGAGRPALAGDAASRPVIVLELFTSQGCSSCPPADALLERYTRRDDVIALSLPVDYWDRLGWKDTFAKKEYTARQQGYALARGDGQVYTPQIVVNGLAHAVGSSSSKIDAAINSVKRQIEARQVSLELEQKGDAVMIKVGGVLGNSPVKGNLLLAVVQNAGKVAIGRGENEGRQVTYHNVVRSLKPVGTWSGSAETLNIPVGPLQSGESLAVLLQEGASGQILAAAHLRDKASF